MESLHCCVYWCCVSFFYTKVSFKTISTASELYGTTRLAVWMYDEMLLSARRGQSNQMELKYVEPWGFIFPLKLKLHSVCHLVETPTAIIIYKCKIVKNHPYSHNSPSSELCLIKEQTIINHSWNKHNEKKYDVHTHINDDRMFREWERMWNIMKNRSAKSPVVIYSYSASSHFLSSWLVFFQRWRKN